MHTRTDQCSYDSSRHVRGRPWGAGLMAGLAVVAAMSVVLVTVAPVQAAVFQCPSANVACLIAAITTANGNGEDDTITLGAGTYTLTAVDNPANGSNGLPSVTSPITIQGAGADRTIIERDASAPVFRLLHVGAEGVLQLEGLTVRGGVAEDIAPEPPPFASNGGGILNFGDVRITNSRLTGNRAGGLEVGGGLANHGGAVTIAQSVVADNRADAGGGLASFDGTVQITESSFLDNSVSHPGGAIWNCGGTATIATSTFARNGGDPAAIANGSDCFGGLVTIVSTTIADSNSNTDGGIFNSGTMLVLNSAIVRNQAQAFDAGGIGNSGNMLVLNTTVADNIGDNIGGIGNSGTLTLINTTVAGNRLFNPDGVGGLQNGPSGTAVLVNTILARNTSEEGVADCVGSVTSLGHNLIGDPTGCTITLQPSDLTGSPGLGSLVDDGTPGHAHLPLLASSRAINAGNDAACPPTDQLGQPRVGRCDIGAIEFPSEVGAVELDIKQARAERLGTKNAKVTLEGRVTGPSLVDIDLGASTVTITSILKEAGVELVAGTSLPFTLEARPGSDADGATFETPGGVRPKFRLDLSHRAEEVVSFRLVVEFAPSQNPALCGGMPRTTELTTSFQIDPSPVSVTTTQPWQCLADDSQVRVPVP
jgi:hypothetical protein